MSDARKREKVLKRYGGSEWAWHWRFNPRKTDHILFVRHIPTGQVIKVGKV